MHATIPFPNTARRTSPLGVGLATLMREPSPAAQQRLLHAAYDAGFRHFDTAPSYGLGAAERVLGTFLRTRPEGVTVGTKFGIVARGNPGLMQLVQRPARALLRRFPALRGRATKAVGAVVHTPTDYSPETRTRSLEGSLRALGVDCLDLLLLHEARPEDVSDGSVVEWMQAQKARGVVRNIGVATGVANAAGILAQHEGVFDVLQVPSDVLTPATAVLGARPASLLVTHSVLAAPLARASARLRADAAWGRTLSERAGTDVGAPGALARLLLAAGLAENESGVVLLGSSSAAHLRAAPAAVGAFPAARVAAAAAFLRDSLGGDAAGDAAGAPAR